jgi:PKD repeat protein
MLLLALSPLTVTPAVYVEVRATTTSTVVISDLAFNPKNVTVKVGSTITWVNKDPLIYTLWFVKVDDGTTYTEAGKEGLSDPILPNASWSQTFNEVITLKYHSFERLWITGFIKVVSLVSPVASFTYEPSEPSVGQMVTFNASASYDADGTIVSYAWDFGDGSRETLIGANLTEIITHTYMEEGTYNVTLTVTDDDGLTASAWKIITVIPKKPFLEFPYIGIHGLALLIIAVIAIGLGAYIYIKRKKVSTS